MKSNTYWQDKVSAWLHDPVCKVFDIVHHEEIAKQIAETLVQTSSDKDLYTAADQIASGLTRAVLPGYNKDPNYNGSIDITVSKEITHPLVKDKKLNLDLPSVQIDNLVEDIKALLKKDLGVDKAFDQLQALAESERPLNGLIDRGSKPEDWAECLFNYLFFAFPRRLRNQNVGKLGALWDVIPADTRIPDHSLWHHLGLTSAIASSMSTSTDKNVSMVVFSITPVQDFISKARKLRDYWTGSVILSYLAFIGITVVMKELGPDHIVYPSLQNQFLVDQWLGRNFNLEKYLTESNDILQKLNNDSANIAAFPNKFVFICNPNDVESICTKIQEEIQIEWIETSKIVKKYIESKAEIKDEKSTFSSIWNKTIDSYWNYSWASSNLAKLSDIDCVKTLLTEQKWSDEFETITKFDSEFKRNRKEDQIYETARLYGSTHSIVQGMLAAAKTKPVKIKTSQNGEKCPLCGEHEVLHNFAEEGFTSAAEYNKATKDFWNLLRDKTNSEDSFAQIGKNERLCAICTIKRFLPVALKVGHLKDHLLYKTLAEGKTFPSTTEMSAFEYLQTQPEEDRKRMVNDLHNTEFDSNDDERVLNKTRGFETKYYAVLLMDGDKMGDLINGETIESTWKDVLSSDLVNRFSKSSFCTQSPFKKEDFISKKRTINPALHYMISDSLNNFARFGVQPIIKKHNGRLIYAGGDDVCAVLPLSKVLLAADEIRQVYNYSFAKVSDKGSVEINTAKTDDLKIGLHLGSGAKKISLSGAIIIAHHKQPLKEVMQDAHRVLDKAAKEKSGRNALAISLQKRSGETRETWFKWNEENLFANDKRTLLQSFNNVVNAAKNNELSTSLLYRIKDLEKEFEPVAKEYTNKKDTIINLFEYEILHSGLTVEKSDTKKEKAKSLAIDLAGLCIKESSNSKDWFNGVSTIIANFMAGGDK